MQLLTTFQRLTLLLSILYRFFVFNHIPNFLHYTAAEIFDTFWPNYTNWVGLGNVLRKEVSWEFW